MYFLRSITTNHCPTLPSAATVSHPPHNFVSWPCWYHRLLENVVYDFKVASNGITPIQDFIIICPEVNELNHDDRQADTVSPTRVRFMHNKPV